MALRGSYYEMFTVQGKYYTQAGTNSGAGEEKRPENQSPEGQEKKEQETEETCHE